MRTSNPDVLAAADILSAERRRRRSARYGESGYERREADFYPTPDWVTDVLCENYVLRGRIWEPAAGDGRMARRLRRHYDVDASDVNAIAGAEGALNFLEVRHPTRYGAIVTNPPFSLSESFVRHAINLTDGVNGIVAMLLRHDWDTAGSRRDLCELLTLKIVLTRRIRWIEGSTGSPRENHAWYVWDHLHLGQRRLLYPRIGAA